MGAFGWPHLLIIFAVIILLFGAAKLPALAKGMGQAARAFKGEMNAMKDDDAQAATQRATVGHDTTAGAPPSAAPAQPSQTDPAGHPTTRP